MLSRGLWALALLSSVASAPVAPLDDDDVKVMRCIVEALADVLAKPQPRPVTHQCLRILQTDDRLVPILRHMDFLKELQDVALPGHGERHHVTPDPVTRTPLRADEADRSMLEALGGPGERSILSQKSEARRGPELPQQDDSAEGNRGHEEKSRQSLVDWDLEKKREGEEQEEESHSDETAEENESEEPTHGDPRSHWEQKHHGREKDRQTPHLSHSHEEEDEEEGMKRGSMEGLVSSVSKRFPLMKEKEKQVHLGSHHSKEDSEEEEEEEMEEKKRNTEKSPEEQELQMIAQRSPEEKKVLEEEGSAVRKAEDQEIESLAAIESELENVAQKLHDLRQG